MKEKSTKYIKNLFLFIFVLTMFLINTTEIKAAPEEGFICTYSSPDNGGYEVKVTLYKNNPSKSSKAVYKKWKGDSENNEEAVHNYSTAFYENSLNWDKWVYEHQKCPPYLLAAHNIQFASVNFSNDTNISYSDDSWNKYKKVLPLTDTVHVTNILNPREVTNLYFKKVESGKGTVAEMNKGGIISTLTVDGQTNNYLYIKTTTGSISSSKYMVRNRLKCTSSNSEVIPYISEPIWDLEGKIFPNSSFATINFKADKAGTSTITCSYTTDTNKLIEGKITITVNSSNKNSYDKQNLTCNYTADYGGIKLSEVKVEVTDYNDGYNTQPGVKYYIKTKGGSWLEATYDKAVPNYQNYKDGDPQMEFYSTIGEFRTALTENNGCPNLYTSLYKGFTGKYYQLTFKQLNDGTLSKADDDFELLNKGCTIRVVDPTSNETIGDVNFLKYKNTIDNSILYSYVMLNGSENETQIGSEIKNVNAIYKQTTTGSHGYVSNTVTEFQFEQAFLKTLYDNYASCELSTSDLPTSACVVKNSSNTASGTTSTFKTVYTLSTDQNKCDLSKDNVGAVTNDDVEIGNEYDAVSAGKTGELNLAAGDNGGDMTCDDYFGPEGSRNSLYDVLKTVITAVRIGTPILLILLTMVDFTKATTNDEALPKAKKHAVTRAIVAVIIFMLPSLVNLVFALIGMESCIIN